MGEVDLVRALALAGIRSAVFAPPGNPARYARTVVERLPWADPRLQPDTVVERLLDFARTQPSAPVLFYDGDWDLLLVSRYRDVLAEAFRFVIADAEMVETLTDKDRFSRLAEEMGLPVPPARRLRDGAVPEDLGFSYPVVVKPITRNHATWRPLGAGGKAIYAEDAGTVRVFLARMVAAGVDAVVQQVVPGPESRIASYHVYVDADGEVAGEFTGRKLRTHPATFGYSTALTVTDIEDVRVTGRRIVERLGLRGVAKLDFKRAPDGTLYLLEINPRFNLWHHPGALAGVNLPATVFADLTGLPRPGPTRGRREVHWCSLRRDAQAAHNAGIGPLRWLVWALRCEAKSGFAWDDPLPLPGALAWRAADRVRSTLRG